MSYKFNPFSRKPDYYESGTTGSVDDVARDNIVNLAWRLAIAESLSVFNLEDGVVDEFEDETGVDTGASSNQNYNSLDDYYSPTIALEIDNMEYSTDLLAQTAFATDAGLFATGLCSGGTAIAESVLASQYASLAFDGDVATFWSSGIKSAGQYTWLAYVFASPTSVARLALTSRNTAAQLGFRDFTVHISTNTTNGTDGDWKEVLSGQNMSGSTSTTTYHTLPYESFIKGIRVTGLAQYYSSDGHYYCQVAEMQCHKHDFQVYSESSIITQGTYSLKGVGTTSGINDYVVRSLATAIDLSGVSWLRLDLRSDRASNNITFGIQQSVSVSASFTPSLTSAGSFERFTWSLDDVSNGAKNSISALYITLINASASNTFYVDRWVGGVLNNMTLISESAEAEEEPTEARLVALVESTDMAVNTDIMGYISNDDGSNYDQVTLTDEGYFDSTKKILAGNVTLTDRSDKTMVQKIETDNSKEIKIHAWGMLWS